MEVANLFRPSSSKPVLRPVTKADENAVFALLEKASQWHVHADWRMPTEWIGQPSCMGYWEGNKLMGYLAATLDPPPVAWIRAVAIDHPRPLPILAHLLDAVITDLQKVPQAESLACMTVMDWLDELMGSLGFKTVHQIETLVSRIFAIPPMPNSAVTLRRVHSADFSLLAEIDAVAFPDPLWWYSTIQLRRAAGVVASFDVAELDGVLVGYIFSTRESKTSAHLVRVAVDPSAQGHGVGTALLAGEMRHYQQWGIKEVTLNTQVDNIQARKLYEKFGFRPNDQFCSVWAMNLLDQERP